MKYDIYCDMDEVLVDFNKGYYDLTGIDIRGIFVSGTAFWDAIKKAGRKFWANLEWTVDGKQLWAYIKKYEPILLSAPSKENDSRIGKHDWANRELPGTRLILRSAEHKKFFAKPNAILIDDRDENIKDWIEAGGIGIHHTSARETIIRLKELGL